MKLVIPITLVLVVTSAALVSSEPDVEIRHGDLKSEASRQKIYEIISSHEDRKFGDHGGHEYEEGEVPRKSHSRKSTRYGYLPNEAKYYYVDQPKQSEIVYEPKTPHADTVYVVPSKEPSYPDPKAHYPVEETAYVQPKRGYYTHDNAYVVPQRPEPTYIVHNAAPKESVYRENVGSYIEDKNAPITIGKTARTVYPGPGGSTHYAAVDPKAPSEYLVLDGQKPRPLILDPKLKATYHLSQPVGHYSAPEHQVIKPEVSVPVHYAAPAKQYEHYDDHHNTKDKAHHADGHGYYKDNALKKESGHKSHGHHDIAGHKAHSSVAGHRDEHDRHHNRGLYERDRGYHYEKAYAYDRVRAHHDIGANRGSHSSYGAHHGQEAHKDAGHHGAETYSYFKKGDQDAGYGYQNGNSLYKKGDGYYGQKYVPVYYHG